jgi:hypothetical protein
MQENESAQAFEAFLAYRDLGAERSIPKAAAKLRDGQGKSDTLLEQWSSKHGWVRRCSAWDRHQNRVINEEVLNGTAEMRRRQASLGIAFQNRAVNALRKLTDADLDKMSVQQLMALGKVGSDMEARARTVKPEEIESHERYDTPMFTIEFLPAKPPTMVLVRMPNGVSGYIPEDALPQFKIDHPEGTVVIA